jgi:hypothetical protein
MASKWNDAAKPAPTMPQRTVFFIIFFLCVLRVLCVEILLLFFSSSL